MYLSWAAFLSVYCKFPKTFYVLPRTRIASEFLSKSFRNIWVKG